jgi:hypothetical protein
MPGTTITVSGWARETIFVAQLAVRITIDKKEEMQPPRRRERRDRRRGEFIVSAFLGVFLGALGASAVALEFIFRIFYHERPVMSKLPDCKETENESSHNDHGGDGANGGTHDHAAIC